MPKSKQDTSGLAELGVYDIQRAALFIDCHRSTIKYHLYTTGYLKPDAHMGRSPVFSRATLDRFKELLSVIKPGPKPKHKRITQSILTRPTRVDLVQEIIKN